MRWEWTSWRNEEKVDYKTVDEGLLEKGLSLGRASDMTGEMCIWSGFVRGMIAGLAHGMNPSANPSG